MYDEDVSPGLVKYSKYGKLYDFNIKFQKKFVQTIYNSTAKQIWIRAQIQ